MDPVSYIQSGTVTETSWRYVLGEMLWRDLIESLKEHPLSFTGLWCDGTYVHALFMQPDMQPLAASLLLENNRYPALSSARPVSAYYERMIFDLYGAEAMWCQDERPLVDHGLWSVRGPLSGTTDTSEKLPERHLVFQPSDEIMQAGGVKASSGPATGGLETPVYIALATDNGGQIRRAEAVNGYAHRGLAQRWHMSRIEEACRLSGRVAAGSSVAHQLAFCQAVEAACGQSVEEEVELLRVVLLEFERITHHLFALAAIARHAGASLVASQCMMFREKLLAVATPVLGSRLLMDHIVPGGVSLQQAAEAGELCRHLSELGEEFYPSLAALWRNYPGLSARLSDILCVDRSMCDRLGVDGPVLRAAGGEGDFRRLLWAYDGVWRFTTGREGGCAEDRVAVMVAETGESLRMLRDLGPRLGLTAGGRTELAVTDSEGIGVSEGPWGMVLYWVTLRSGRVERVYVRDPAAAALMVFEAALSGQDISDLELGRASLGVNAAAYDG
ncbi:NADH-quinone oxidoreductase subunit D-related protein [Acetobacter thailandicus]|uniref:NADH-quinone oxidoreductase subunit D n=1 Tax=Acetobacter thailandicus TaxID=1502842 RepID=A0ABT3QEW4_9PROT|nr:NADH-quinone oxidoreductase subunit D [Acetobacter thailandicus]MCX2563819.1 NADH-quinone oxidoreductase subunit D [Acetobacter thailandicus]NHN95107.1 NADH-quinone oxidoreductase subunit D [Acetobacter thailandicus]